MNLAQRLSSRGAALTISMVCGASSVVRAQVNDTLAAAVDRQAMAQAPGAQRVGPMIQNVTPKTDWTAVLEQGKCYWFSGGGAVGVQRLSLYLWGPDGRRVTDSRPHSTWATIAYCPPYSAAYHVQVKIEGNGYYVVGQYARAVANTVPPPVYIAPPAVTVSPSGVYYSPGWGVAPGVAVAVPAAQPPQCSMGSDGISVCGYNCVIGSNGHMYCSGVPNARCALNADGTFACPGAPAMGYGYGPPPPHSFHSVGGVRNDLCGSSLDCGSGLFCRDPGDGTKICM